MLLENRTATKNHFIQFELIGTGSERDAIGTRVSVTAGDSMRVVMTATGDGYEGRNEPLVHFGLAEHAATVDVSIDWPSGEHQQLTALPVDHRYLITEDQETAWPR